MKRDLCAYYLCTKQLVQSFVIARFDNAMVAANAHSAQLLLIHSINRSTVLAHNNSSKQLDSVAIGHNLFDLFVGS